MIQRLSALCLLWPRATLVVVVIVTVGFGLGMPRLRTDTGYRSFLGSSHPAVVEFDGFLEAWGEGLPISIVWSCVQSTACDGVFDERSLRMAAQVADALGAVDGVRRVEGPATSALLVPTEYGFDVRRLDGAAASDDLVERALADPLWRGTVVAPDGDTAAIVVQLVSSDSEHNYHVMGAIEETLAPHQAAGFEFHLVGDPVEYVVAGGELDSDTARLMPAMIGLIAATVFVLFRSMYAVVSTLLVVGLAVVWTLGAMGWIGWPQTNVTQTLAPLILVIGVCNGIHVLSQTAAASAQPAEGGWREVLSDRVARIVPPCQIATLTTAAGFLAFTASGLESFSRFGAIAAFGILASLLLSFTALPVLLLWAPSGALRLQKVSESWDAALTAMVRTATGRYLPILLVSAAMLLVAVFGITRLRVDVDIYQLYGEQSRVVKWARFVEAHLRRPDSIEIDLSPPGGGTFEDPQALQELARVAALGESTPGLGRARSIVDTISWVNRLLNDDSPNFERVGDSAESNAEILFLLSLEGSETLDPWTSLSRNRARLSIEADKEPQSRRTEIIETMAGHLAPLEAKGWSTTLTGPMVVAHALVEEVQRTQLLSLSAAIAVVLLLVMIFLKSPGWALLGMIPTTLPVFLTLGAMGLAGIALDVGTAMVSAIIIGIAVDDTVHLLFRYRADRLEGIPPREAIEAALRAVGQPVITTSIALTLGMFALTLSPWQSVASFGFLSGVAILGALAADLFVLPALIVLVSHLGTVRGAGQ